MLLAIEMTSTQAVLMGLFLIAVGIGLALLVTIWLYKPPSPRWQLIGSARLEYRVYDSRGRHAVVRAAHKQLIRDDVWIVSYQEHDLLTPNAHLVLFKGNILGSEDWADEVMALVMRPDRDFLSLIAVDFEVKNKLLDDVHEAHHYRRHFTLFLGGETVILCSRENFDGFDEPWLLKSSIGSAERVNWSTIDLPHQAAKALQQMNETLITT